MGRKKELYFHPHGACAMEKLIKYTGDPLLAKCTVDGEVHVASTLTPCPLFKKRTMTPEIEHRKKRLGLTDTYI